MTTDRLSDRAFLIAWNPDRQKMTGGSEHRHLVSAALLIELWLAGRITDERGKVALAAPRPDPRHPGQPDPVQQIMLRWIDEARPKPWKHWVTSGAKEIHAAVRARLEESRAIDVGERSLLGLGPEKVTVRDDQRCRDLVSNCQHAVLATTPAAEVPILDAALVAVTAAVELNTVLTGHQRRAYRERIAEFAVRSGPAAKALRSVITDNQTSAAAAGVAAG